MIKDISSVIIVKSLTCYKASNSFFDYDSTKFDRDQFTFQLVPQTVSIYRERQDTLLKVTHDQQHAPNLQKYQLLIKLKIQLYIEQNKPKVKVHLIEDTANEEKCYLNISKIKNLKRQVKGYKLSPRQTIKLGRTQYYIHQIPNNQSISSTQSNSKRQIKQLVQTKIQNVNTCRICFQGQVKEKGQLLNPCKCLGELGYSHSNCLVDWMQIKVDPKATQRILQFKKLQCEICRSKLPITINNDNKVQLLYYDGQKSNQVVLQSIIEEKGEQKINMIRIKDFPVEGIKFGRNKKCQISSQDCSITAIHAQMREINGNFYLFDNKSKYGTLVRHQNMVLQLQTHSYGVQIGKTLLLIELKDHSQQQSSQVGFI